MEISKKLKNFYLEIGFKPTNTTKNILDVWHTFDTKNNKVQLTFFAIEYVNVSDLKIFLKAIEKNLNIPFTIFIEYKNFNYTYENVVEYWDFMSYWLPNLYTELRFINKKSISLENKTLTINFLSKKTYDLADSKKEKFEGYYKRFGFKEIKINLNFESNNILEEELKQHKQVAEKAKTMTKADGYFVFTPPTNPDKYKSVFMENMTKEKQNVCIYGAVSTDVSAYQSKNASSFGKGQQIKKTMYSFRVANYKNSIQIQTMWGLKNKQLESMKPGTMLKIFGTTRMNEFRGIKKLIVEVKHLEVVDEKTLYNIKPEKQEQKRVELHAHTKMSTMDSIVSAKELVNRAADYGHSAIAITDHNSAQSFPEANYASKATGVKIIYGLEVDVIDIEDSWAIKNPSDKPLNRGDFVFFDLETTGLNAEFDEIIEIGASRYENIDKINTMQEFVMPERRYDDKRILNPFTTELTGITEDDMKKSISQKEAIMKFKDYIGDSIIVAHNAEFDYSFIKKAYKKHGLGELKNPIIDTMKIAWAFLETRNFRLGTIARKLGIEFDSLNAHRADYDADKLGEIYWSIENQIRKNGAKNLIEAEKLIMERVSSKLFASHINILAKNEKGIKRIYELVSESSTEFITNRGIKTPIEEIFKNREDILIGSGCYNSLVWKASVNNRSKLPSIYEKLDYVEVQTPAAYSHLVDSGKMKQIDVIKNIEYIVKTAKEAGLLVVATGDVHLLSMRDKLPRDIIINSDGKGGKKNPLFSWKGRIPVPDQSFKTTEEMLEAFKFLGSELAKEIVVTNTNIINDMIQKTSPVKKDLYIPEFKEANEVIMTYANKKFAEYYGTQPDEIIKKRLEQEIDAIEGNNFNVFFYLVHVIVQKSLSDNYLVGSRGSVGSSLFAWLTDISEVNPLAPHYVCKVCHKVVWNKEYDSCLDMPDKYCKKCDVKYEKQGYEIPFETFLGFDGTKVPDIDLNFSGVYQSKIHEFTKTLFKENKVFRAGTISTVASKTAFGYVKKYFEMINDYTDYPNDVVGFIADKITGVKRTTGSHPGGLILVPEAMDINDFTPINYSGDNFNEGVKTTHFDYHAIDANLLKLDLLGHDDPTFLRDLYDDTGIDPRTVNMGDEKIIKIFSSLNGLNIDKKIFNVDNIGILGIPEFGTKFARGLVKGAKPKSFADLIRISGLSHGTDVWQGNAEVLIKNKVATLNSVVSCRDDIMNYLIDKGVDKLKAFKIMEKVRKGIKLPEEDIQTMKDANVPEWYIESTKKIKYLFPKAHASAYVLMALKITWYKVYQPLAFYAAYFKNRCDSFDLDILYESPDAIKNRLELYNKQDKAYEITAKDSEIKKSLELALEMISRGYKFERMDIAKVSDEKWLINEKEKSLMPPLNSIDGLGHTVAEDIVGVRSKSPFLSKKDLLARTKIGKKQMPVFEKLGLLDELKEDDSRQMSLFD